MSYDTPQGQIDANYDHGDELLADLFQFYLDHMDDWEEGNVEYETVKPRSPLQIWMVIKDNLLRAVGRIINELRHGRTHLLMGSELQPHFQGLRGLRLKQAVLFGTLWEKEYPYDRPGSPYHEEDVDEE